VEEAHNDGRKVACHASILASAERAIRAGVDTIEHGCDLDQASVEQIAANGITLVPTLLVHVRTMENWDRFKDIPMYKAIPIRQRQHRRSFELALSAGVRIAAGVDAADDDILEFAAVAEEVKTMVDYGLTPMQGVESATRTAAEALGLAEMLGTVEKGKWADLIAVDGDPSVDAGALLRVALTVKAGKVEYRKDRLSL
jgi:imidazolonepropionase-like amidohydrolase